ncbi:Histone deacetylase [Melia azedarach]|uniref:Histone deacetylase n=1 Tax=Melia azedarach TaxID=155640 RepID=A0ACC1WU31_MELAZ|nr:Histone deacetylase [Melia azedarach]
MFRCCCCCWVAVVIRLLNVARYWCYETGVALGVELKDKMPEHEYYQYVGPEHTLHVAPSVQFQEPLPDTEFPEVEYEDKDDGSERGILLT